MYLPKPQSLCLPQIKKTMVFGTTTWASMRTLSLDSTYDPNYCVSGPSDRNPQGKGVAIKYNSYTRYLNRIRNKSCIST